MTQWEIRCDDVLRWAAEYDGPKFGAILTDPPYHLTGGFMSKDWDKDGPDAISFQKETWAALAEHLLPGGFIMAFASSRGWHRLACAMEDAGLIIQPSIFNWHTKEVVEIPLCFIHLTGQSFPKSTRITSRASDSSPFCQCVGSLQQSLGHDSQNSARDAKSKDVDSQSDYSQDSHLDDVPPRRAQVGGPDAVPLQDDAQGHSHSDGPLLDAQGGSAPLHSPYQAPHSVHPPTSTFQDSQESSDDVSQSLRVSEGETYHEYDSQQPNIPLNKTAVDSALVCKADDKLACRKLHTHSLDDGLPSGSLDNPFVESFAHDTTKGLYCQICGKVKQDIWGGHRYGGQVLKDSGTPVVIAMKPPATELSPIIVAQKPWEGKRLDCIVETGAGSLWVDGGRIGFSGDGDGQWHSEPAIGQKGKPDKGTKGIYGYYGSEGEIKDNIRYTSKGRWPANFALCHVPPDENGEGGCRRVGVKRVKAGTWGATQNTQCGSSGTMNSGWAQRPTINPGVADPDGMETVDTWECAENCPVARLDEQAGERKSGGTGGGGLTFHGQEYVRPPKTRGPSTGGASRFFLNADWSHEVAERLAGADPVRYCPKAAKRERQSSLDDFHWRKDKAAPIGFARIDEDEWEALGEEEERVKEETGKQVSLRAQGNIHSTRETYIFECLAGDSPAAAKGIRPAPHPCPLFRFRQRDDRRIVGGLGGNYRYRL